MPDAVEKLYGSYKLISFIGGDTTGSVYEAEHIEHGGSAAVRVLSPAPTTDVLNRYLSQLKVIAALQHTHLVPIYQFGAVGETAYIAMMMMTGGSLRARLNQRFSKNLPLPSVGEVCELLMQISAALDYIHQQGIVHHHVDPRNMMFDADGDVYLADTGVAKLFKVAFSLQTTGSVASHRYSPPEQWLGENVSAASDQYSLAATIYFMLTGHMVFDANSIFGLMQQHLNDIPTPPHYVRNDIPASLTIPLLRALAKKPEDRYSTVTEFYQDFVGALDGSDLGQPTGFFTFPLD